MAKESLIASLSRPGIAAAVVLVVALATIATALAFEHLGGYAPCPLCLQQRYAYYAGIPLAAVALAAARGQGAALLPRILLGLIALGFLVNAGLGVYHSGVEWHWWPGPAACGTVQEITGDAGSLVQSLNKTRVIACDEAPWRLLGLSFAGWNVVISAGLALVALAGALGRRRVA